MMVLVGGLLTAVAIASEDSGLELAGTEGQRREGRSDCAVRFRLQRDGLRPCRLRRQHVLNWHQPVIESGEGCVVARARRFDEPIGAFPARHALGKEKTIAEVWRAYTRALV